MMLAREAKTQAQAATKITSIQQNTNKKATREVTSGWLYDGSLSDYC
jgi:hypothetical protein